MNKATWMLITAVFLWGITIVPTKWALETVPPFTLTFLRLALGSLVFLPLAWVQARRRGNIPPIPWGRMCLLSFAGVAGYFILGYSGIALTSGVHASILSASLPLFTILFAFGYLKEPISSRQWLGLALGVAGVVVISAQPESDGTSSLLGDALVLASCLLWAVYVVLMKRPGAEAGLPSELFTALTLAISSVMLLPLAAGEMAMQGIPQLTAKAWWSLLYLTVGATILAYWLWNRALEHVSAGSAGIYLNALPLISVAASILLLEEALTWRSFAGGCLVLAGVFWAEQKRAAGKLAASPPAAEQG